MSKRITLTDTEIEWIISHINNRLGSSIERGYIFQVKSLRDLKDKLTTEPVTKPKGLLKINHNTKPL